MSHITADYNGAYVKTRNKNKLYCEVGENAHAVHMDDNQYFYNTRNSNTCTKSYVSINDVIMLKRSYCVLKSWGQLLHSLPQRTALTYLMSLFFIKLIQTCQKVPQYRFMIMQREQMLGPSFLIKLRMTF